MDEAPSVDPSRPRVALRRADQQILLNIAYGGLLTDARSAAALLYRASSAELIANDDKLNTVRLWSKVLYLDASSGSLNMITLAPPQRSHIPSGRVSVLSPLGAALIGLSKGQHIHCPDRHGGELRLTVLDIFSPQE